MKHKTLLLAIHLTRILHNCFKLAATKVAVASVAPSDTNQGHSRGQHLIFNAALQASILLTGFGRRLTICELDVLQLITGSIHTYTWTQLSRAPGGRDRQKSLLDSGGSGWRSQKSTSIARTGSGGGNGRQEEKKTLA